MLPRTFEKEIALLEKFFTPPLFTQTDNFPRTDIFIEDKYLVFEFALAGYEKENLNVSFEEGKLFVSGKSPEIKDGRKYIQHKLSYRNFDVAYIIPLQYNNSTPAAKFENGILEVCFVKNEEVEKKNILIN